jgi:DNA invertase Pin-like site-specific DNA recombinase
MAKHSRTTSSKAGRLGVAAVYCRTSKEDRASKKVSIEQQVDDGSRLALENGYSPKPYIDRDRRGSWPPPQWAESSGVKTRASLGELIRDIESGSIKAVVFRSRDRLARNTRLSLRFWEFCDDHKVAVFATHEHIAAANDPSGRFILTVLVAASQMELERIQTNIKAGKAYAKRHRMKVCGVRTVGYRDGRDAKGISTIEVDPVGAECVKELYRRYIAGETYGQLCDWAQREYPDSHPPIGKRWYRSTVRRVLSNTAYIGEGVQPYPRIIEHATFLAAQKCEASRRNVKWGRKLRKHLLSGGVLRCGYDGLPMIAYMRYDKAGEPIETEYKCAAKHADGRHPFSMRESLWLEWVERYIATATKIAGQQPDGDRLALELRRDTVSRNIEGFETMAAKGELTFGRYTDLTRQARTELARLDGELAKIAAASASDLSIPWSKMTFAQRRQRLTETLESVVVYRTGVMVRFNPSWTMASHRDAWGLPEFARGLPSVPYWFPLWTPKRVGMFGQPLRRLVPLFEVGKDCIPNMEPATMEGVECMEVIWDGVLPERPLRRAAASAARTAKAAAARTRP